MSFPRTQSLSLVYRGKGLNLEKKCGTEPSDQGLEGFSNTLHLYQSVHRYYSDGTDAPLFDITVILLESLLECLAKTTAFIHTVSPHEGYAFYSLGD